MKPKENCQTKNRNKINLGLVRSDFIQKDDCNVEKGTSRGRGLIGRIL